MIEAAVKVFISFNSKDSTSVELLARSLEQCGLEIACSEKGIAPGAAWQAWIGKSITECSCCLVCIGPSGISNWQAEEINVANDLRVQLGPERYRLIPVLMPGLQRPRRSDLPNVFLTSLQWFELDYDFEKSSPTWGRLVDAIRNQPSESPEPAVRANKECPYAGLKTFDVNDAPRFFGRSRLTEWMISDMKAALGPVPTARFLCLIGPSGSGKSSLARAGLTASLQQDAIPGSSKWRYEIFEPGKEPKASLAQATDGDGADSRRLFLLVDQFEQVFSMCKDNEQRSEFIQELLDRAKSQSKSTIVVITVRADYYGEIAAFPDLAAAVADHQILVGSMSEDELHETIERPAELAGRKVDRALVERLIAEVKDQPWCLPLLQDTLVELWNRPGGPDLSLAGYKSIGQLERVLELRAERLYGSFSREQKEACSQVFRSLVEFSGGKYSKVRIGRDELLPAGPNRKTTEEVVAALAGPNVRLIVFQDDCVEVAHEALIRNWPRLQAWIDDANQQFLVWRRRLGLWLRDWEVKEDPSYLLRGTQLDEARKWRDTPGVELSDVELKFIKKSFGEARKHTVKIIAAAAALALVIGAGGGYQLQSHRSDELAHSATDLLKQSDKPELALLLALDGVKMKKFLRPWAETGVSMSALEWAVQQNLPEGESASQEATSLAIAPRGNKLAAAWADGAVHIWKIEGAAPKQKPEWILKHPDVKSIGFDNQGERLVTGGSDLMARVWKDGSAILTLRHPDTVSGVAWRPKHDDQLATVSQDGILRMWTVSGNDRELDCKKPHCIESEADGKRLNCVGFSPDGEFLVTGGAAKNVKFWNPETMKKTGEVQLTDEPVSVDFSPDSNYVAIGGIKGATMALARTSDTPSKLEDRADKSEEKISAVRFLDNDRLAAASADGTIRIWRFRDLRRLLTLRAAASAGFFGVSYRNTDETLFAAQNSRTLSVFPLRPADLLRQAQDRLEQVKKDIDQKDCALYDVKCP